MNPCCATVPWTLRPLFVAFLASVTVLACLKAGFVGSVAAADPALVLSRGAGDTDTLDLTIEELAAMPQTTIVTENEFSNGAVTYRGPLVLDVLAKFSLDQVETVRFIAANDYSVEIPTSDFREYPVILAMEANGQRLSRREMGPLWLMYPLSDHPELQDPVHNDRLIWQVVRIESP